MKLPGKKGFTLVELITTAVIISVIAAVTGGVVVTLFQLFVYIPSEVEARMISYDIAQQVIEGASSSRGLRYAASITDAHDNSVTYTVGYPSTTDQYTVTLTYDPAADKVYYKIGSGSNVLIPYNAVSGIVVTCPSGIFFKYYTAAGASWTSGGTDTYNIARVEITYTVSGSVAAQGSFTTTVGTNVEQYN